MHPTRYVYVHCICCMLHDRTGEPANGVTRGPAASHHIIMIIIVHVDDDDDIITLLWTPLLGFFSPVHALM